MQSVIVHLNLSLQGLNIVDLVKHCLPSDLELADQELTDLELADQAKGPRIDKCTYQA